jgi:MFS superfamily sulfate permease-like transporter
MNQDRSLLFSTFKSDFPASIVVFLVALPLCLGVAVASGANPFAGIIAGVIGGIVVGFLSGSPLSVSGPAAGLTSIVALAIDKFQHYDVFLVAVVLAGLFQILMGIFKAGIIGSFIPNSVIKGMLAAIGIILIMKQIPHFLGYDADPEGDESFFQVDHNNTFSEILNSLNHFTPLAIFIGTLGIFILIVYEMPTIKKSSFAKFIPGPLIVVIAGVAMNEFIGSIRSDLKITSEHLVKLPVLNSMHDLVLNLTFPKWSEILNPQVWVIAITIALVASIETLLSLEAVDDLDPQKRISPPNKELIAQGIGNSISGFFGGLPITSVIVRSSANVNTGAKTKLSSILHGVLLFISALFLSRYLNKIPLSALAAILLFTGYKLSRINIFKEYYKQGFNQFIPFLVTVLAIVFTDLLKGVAIGILVGLFYTVRSNFKTSVSILKDESRYLLKLKKEVSFLNKGIVKSILMKIPNNTAILIDATKADFVDQDIIDLVNDFIINAQTRSIRVYVKKIEGKQNIFNDITKNTLKN